MIITNDYDKLRDYFYKSYIIAYPTDTIYGLGVNSMSEEAVNFLYEAKNRPKNKNYILLVQDMTMLQKYAILNPKQKKLIKELSPHYVTFVLKASNKVPQWLVDKRGTIAFRMANHPFVSEFFKYISVPLVSTSANISSFPNAQDELEVAAYFNKIENLAIVIDKWDNYQKTSIKNSTVIDISKEPYQVLRKGTLNISFPRSKKGL